MMIISDFLLGICLNHGEKKLTWLAGKPPISSIGNYIFKWWIFHCRVGFRVVLFGLWTSCHFFFMLKKMTNISSKFLGAFLTEKKNRCLQIASTIPPPISFMIILPQNTKKNCWGRPFRFPSYLSLHQLSTHPLLTVQVARPWWKNSRTSLYSPSV